MNMKKLNLILLFTLIFFIVTADAARGSRRGRQPNKTDEDPTIKFRQAVEMYKKIREEKKKRSLLAKREEAINKDDEIAKANMLLLLGKHDSSQRSLFEMDGDNLVQNEYVLETVDDTENTQEEKTNNLVPDETTKLSYKVVKVKTVVKTIKKTIKNLKTASATNTPVDKATRTIYKTVKAFTKTAKKATTTNAPVAVNNAISNEASNTPTTGNDEIYQPKPGTKFQWQLSGCDKVNTSVNADVFDIDLFDTPDSKIKELKSKGKKVICYFSGGTIESWRDDAEDFLDKGVVLAEMKDWKNENWVNINSKKLKPLIQKRLDYAVEKGCDGVEIDNVDGYTFDENDFTYKQQLEFNKWLAIEAHKRKLSIGLKNDMNQIKDLLPYYDWALNEECYEYGEGDKYKPFIEANKAVFGVSYVTGSKKIAEACKTANKLNLDYQIKKLDLDSSKIDCSVYE